MLSKTTTYWLAGLGVVGVAAAAPVVLKYYHIWPSAAEAPVPLVSPKIADVPAAPAAPNAAPAPAAPAAAQVTPPTSAPAASAEPAASPPSPPMAVATNNPASPPVQPAAPLSAKTDQPAAAAAPSSPIAPSPSAKANQPPTSGAAPSPAAPAPAAKPDQQRPAFDVVRVEPTGDAVIAGRASPRAAVQLRSDGQVVAQVDADESGQFAILPPPFSAGGHRLQLAARTGGASEVLSDAIGIEVPATAEAAPPSPAPVSRPAPPAAAQPAKPAAPKPAEAARAEPPAPAKVAPAPEAPQAPPPGPAKVAALDKAPAGAPTNQPVVSILSVEANGAGRLEAKGAAEPNATVRLYLNNTYVAEAIAGADGRWSLTVERGMTPGAYAIRADEIDHASGAVIARAEVPFAYPERPTAAQVAAATPMRALDPPVEKTPAKPMSDKPAPAIATAAPPAPRPAPQAAPAPAATAPATGNSEAPKAPTPPAAVESAPQPPKTAEADAPAKTAPAPASAPAAAEAPAVAVAEPSKPTDGANPVVPEIRTTKVVRGDNLWNLSKHFYGYGPNYKVIYEANSSQIRNPRLIYPDQIFVVPPKPAD